METPAIMEDGVDEVPARPRLWSPQEMSFPPPETAPAETAPAARTASHPKHLRAGSPRNGKTASLGEPEGALPLRYSPTIKELPAGDRPRERLAAYGASALTTAELLAILIRVGNAQRSAVSLGEHLLAHFGNVRAVACASVEQLAKVHGIGAAKAAQIKAAIEFGNRVSLFSGDTRPTIGSPTDVSNLLMPELSRVMNGGK